VERKTEFLIFATISSIIIFSTTLWQTLLPLYLDFKGLKPWEIGISVSLVMNLGLLLAFTSGYVVDLIDWRKSAILAVILLLTATLLLLFAQNFIEFLILAFIIGLSTSLITQASVKVLVKSSIEKRGLLYSSYMLLSNIGRIIASYLSGFIATIYGYSILFMFSAATLLPAFGLLAHKNGKRKDYSTVSKASMKKVLKLYLRDTRLKILVSALFLHDFSVFIGIPYLILYAKYVIGIDEVGAGILTGTRILTQLIFQLGSGWLADKIGGSLTLAIHFLTISLAYITYSNTIDFLNALLIYAFMGFAMTLDFPARRLLITKYAPEEYVAAINGLADTIVGVGTMFSAIIGGYLWNINPSLPILTAGIANLSTIPLILYLKHRKQALLHKYKI